MPPYTGLLVITPIYLPQSERQGETKILIRLNLRPKSGMYCIGTNKLEKRNLKVELVFSIHKSFILFSVSSDYVSKHNLQGVINNFSQVSPKPNELYDKMITKAGIAWGQINSILKESQSRIKIFYKYLSYLFYFQSFKA